MDQAQNKISIESKVDNPLATIENFNRQFQLGKGEKEAGNTMFNIVNAYTRAAQFDGLPAEASFRVQKVGGMILGMVKENLPHSCKKMDENSILFKDRHRKKGF